MDLVDLVLTVCLVANAQQCTEKHLYFENRGNLQQCIFQSQLEIARWAGDHPQYAIKRWRCEYPDKAKDI